MKPRRFVVGRDSLTVAVPIVDVVSKYVELTPYADGSYFMGLCPVHDDHSPSLSVRPSSGLWKCWKCDTGGDAVQFLQFVEKCSEIEALGKLEAYTVEVGDVVATVVAGRKQRDVAYVRRARKPWAEVALALRTEEWFVACELSTRIRFVV